MLMSIYVDTLIWVEEFAYLAINCWPSKRRNGVLELQNINWSKVHLTNQHLKPARRLKDTIYFLYL